MGHQDCTSLEWENIIFGTIGNILQISFSAKPCYLVGVIRIYRTISCMRMLSVLFATFCVFVCVFELRVDVTPSSNEQTSSAQCAGMIKQKIHSWYIITTFLSHGEYESIQTLQFSLWNSLWWRSIDTAWKPLHLI